MYIPEDLNDLLTYLDTHQSGVQLIANGSDLINRMQRREVSTGILVDLSGLSEFNFITKDDNIIRIGALTTIHELATSQVLGSRYDVFREVASKFGGPAIMNVATVGGNLCAASSSEDLIPIFLALDAKVKVTSKKGERVISIEDFLKNKRQTALLPNEIMSEIMFKEFDEQSTCAFEKIGMRNSLIIAFLNCAVYMKIDKTTNHVKTIRVALNRVSGKIPARAKKTENVLEGKKLSEQFIEIAMATLRSELELSSDFRVTKEYRDDVAPILLKRAIINCTEKLGERLDV
jgi:carbon-monoxide dehydrogenase medium subunit